MGIGAREPGGLPRATSIRPACRISSTCTDCWMRVPALDFGGKRYFDRRAVRLERRVRPVAFVFGLKDIALHQHACGQSGTHLMADRPHVGEWLSGRNVLGKC